MVGPAVSGAARAKATLASKKRPAPGKVLPVAGVGSMPVPCEHPAWREVGEGRECVSCGTVETVQTEGEQ